MWNLLDKSHLRNVLQLRDRVLAELTDKDHYVRESDEFEFVLGHLGQFGKSWGWYDDEGQLAAYCALTTDLQLAKEDIEYSLFDPAPIDAILAVTMVLEEYRGQGLQEEAIQLRLKHAKKLGLKRCLVQVSPTNIYSLRSLLNSQFHCNYAIIYSDCRKRLLLSRDVESPAKTPTYCNISAIGLQDFAKLHTGLNGERFGVSLHATGNENVLLVGEYAK